MALHGSIAWLTVGAMVSQLAGTLVKGGGLDIFVDIVVGTVGTFIDGWLAEVLDISLGGGWIGSIVTVAIGTVILLFIIRLIKHVQRAPAPASGTAVDAHVIQPPDFNMHRTTQTG